MGKRDQKTTCLAFGGQFKYPVGEVLSISREEAVFGGPSEIRQDLEREGVGH